MNGAEKWTLLTMLVCAVSPLQAQHPPPIVSISVCNSNGTGGSGSCPSGTFDTHQIVLGPGGVSVNKSGFDPAPDEHSTVFAPGALGSRVQEPGLSGGRLLPAQRVAWTGIRRV
jgi:hypothetical protein